MTGFEKRIYDIVASSDGIRGSEIASLLNVDKKEVNSVLSRSHALQAVLVQSPDYKWHLLASAPVPPGNETPNADSDLRNLCNYYLQCLSQESSTSVSQYLTSRYDTQYEVLSRLEIDPVADPEAMALLRRIQTSRDKKAYLGYPVRIFTFNSREGRTFRKIAPVFLFELDYTSGIVSVSRLPSINMEVMKAYCPNDAGTLASELFVLETELGMNDPESDTEADELVLRLRNIRDWEWAETIDPYNIPPAESLVSFRDGIYNRPVVISAERTNYTAGLEAELMALSNMPEEAYRDTALYAWIKGGINGDSPAWEMKPLLEVLPLNSEQSQAVETALNSDLTIVTGPPGTGKSQVVTDLLVNIAWNGKSALFSSHNNKAVDVVDCRVNALSARPSLLRIGSNQYAARLADIIVKLLSSSSTAQDQSDLQFLQLQYDRLIDRERELRAQKEQLVQERNAFDEKEQIFCSVREIVGDHLLTFNRQDCGRIASSAKAYANAVERLMRENNGFFARLFWGRVEPERYADMKDAENTYNAYAARYGLKPAGTDVSPESAQELVSAAEKFEAALSLALEYRPVLESGRSAPRMEDVDAQLADIKARRADIAQQLWDKWLKAKNISFTYEQRREMSNYVSAMKLTDANDLLNDPELRRQYTEMVGLLTEIMQCWAVTSLSAKSRIPFSAHLFDYVIIDEASQCDIASIIPLLYRAKRAVIIGDPMQLQHISQLSRKQDHSLLKKYQIAPMWSYSANSLYALASGIVRSGSIIQLKDHFRSCEDIIGFSNEFFYDGTLRTATRHSMLKPPPG
ncbi:MAG: AAA family ATPase, partial [Oscillospiraceae bacterium]|nr:AAA family ATPase [Oscillospiraceae bacterium]